MNKTITLNAGLGASLGPNFNLTANVGNVTPSSATKTELLNGFPVVLDNEFAATITIASVGSCTNSLILPIVDIYYGTGLTSEMTAYEITTQFNRVSGNVGSPTGRYYSFSNVDAYRFWAIPDLPNTGDRVIMQAFLGDGITVLDMEPPEPFYTPPPFGTGYYQENPYPPTQTIEYGKLSIYGIMYRLYRTTYTHVDSTYKIYSEV